MHCISVCDLYISNKKNHTVALWNSNVSIPSVAVVWLSYVFFNFLFA
jgi:hypothetical protein